MRAVVSPQAVGLGVSSLILLTGLFSKPPAGLSIAGQRAIMVFLVALVLWLTRPVPYIVSSILSVTLLYALGVVESFAVATTGYASSLIFFLLALLLLGNAIADVDLDRQVAQQLLRAETTPQRTLQSIAGSILGLALVMPSAMARAVTFIPIVEQIASEFNYADGSDFEQAAFLILGHVNPIASMALMTGGGMALVTSEIINSTVRSISWVDWALLMVPPTVLLYVLATVAAIIFTTIGEARQQNHEAAKTTDSQSEGGGIAAETTQSLSREQWIVAAVTGGAVVSWIIGSFIGIPTVLPAVVAVTVLALPRIEVITATDAADVSWGIIFLIGAMLSILDAMQTTGAIQYIVDLLTVLVPFGVLAQWQIIGVLLAIAVGVRVLFSTGSAAIVVALPIVLEFGGEFGINQLYLALAVLLVVGSTTLLPFNTTAVLVSMDHGPLSHRNVATFGTVMMVLSVIVAAGTWLIYWPLVT
ncbi:sodium:sulfate symporter [Haloarcula rubripromontorii]|uniref:Sodium:sulfate symporter n=2 Tax=Haloarcula rubripromontorii TaxID=1705562 RepID=A0A0M9AJE8_9EURY|nr:sodium:sulfate symporter [Haloarcula rubripromontorii]